ncbi:hypothetical protein MG293_017715 [Ovis ammon polii]|uniref:Multiple epidermal growth factor-like domains protein 2 n=1 Tax=Ovis ammon polii TaxID=230172 RepID=A0AAD4XZV7_OVIAM|nr:hypothetical protein MG293_017715 [Ovis ammon polii]
MRCWNEESRLLEAKKSMRRPKNAPFDCREELGNGGGHGWDPGVAAATGPGARIGNGALALCPEPPGVREDGEPGLGVREPVFVGLRGGRQSAQNGRGPPEQPGLGAEYGVKTFGSRGRETGQGPGSLLCWRPEVSSCRLTGPLRRDSLSPEGLSPGVPGPENNPPFPSDLLIRPRGSQPVSSQRNTGRGSSPKVGTTRCCGELWGPGRRGQSERTATSRARRTGPRSDRPPGAVGSGPGLDSAPRTARTAPASGSAPRESRTAPVPKPERMRPRGLFRLRFLPQRPGPRPPGAPARPGAWRVPLEGRARPRRAANRHPQFPQYNYQALVPENEAAGTAVLRVVAQDPDTGEAGRLVYSLAALMNSRSLDLFSIDPQSGLIRTEAALDRESMDRHYLRVTAQDHGSPRLSATTMVAVTVADRNDHAPVFEQAQYRETLRENVEEGYPILQLRATDGDAPPNANLRYRFVGPPAARAAAADAFEIDPRSGLISTSGRVDREHMESYELVVEASDQGQEPGPRSATVRVHITVLDENDNAPQFSEKRYVAQVREDVRPHTVVLRVTATDRDKDANGLVHYNIISGNSRGHFAIDSLTGEIQVVAPLDFEAEREYALRIRAQDAGRPPLSNNTGLASIQVVDINDHTPIFVSTPFQVSVLENAPLGHSVIHIQAVDADHGENSRLEYSLTGVAPDTPFVINSATGWVSVSGPLDRESVEHYFFGVEARDHGSPPLSASASVTVTVLDVNDNRPEFTMKEYHLRLNEDATVGTSVVSVTAVDRDANSAISYQITGGNTRNRFAISTQGGVGLVTLALPLDYKQERYFKLVLTASDRALHDHCYVHINITDANTHRPVFQSAHYSVSVNEDRPVGSTVVVISASDDDVGENARITYLLEDNLPQFRIDADSGAITLQAPLDYEDQVTYTLAITARDNGIPQKADTTYVEVMVNDVNDNAPQFVASHYTGLVSEDAPPFTSVLQISATDRDAHANGRVQYTFQNGEDGDGDFTIEPTSGIVRTVRRLDREAVPVYELTAYAVDRGVPPLRTPVSIQVTVQDVNDNAPVFPAEEFEVRVKENSIVGSVVAQITAVDPDEGPNAHIMYQIVEGNIPELFQMDIFSGELTALIDLDYEARQEYVIVVQATSAPLVSRATVHVRLVDQNDNSPVLNNFQILFNNYVSNHSDTFPSGIIGRIPAYDPDVSDHLFYSFERGNELQLLVVNQTSGELRLSRKLDNNRPLVASMLVTVTDGLHSVTAQCVLRVVIITEELLANSLTVRLENMWQERFLSPLLGHFLEGVAAVLATPTEDVFIFNIQNDTDVGGTVLNVSFSALAPRGAGAGSAGPWFSSEELQEQLYVRRAALAARSLLDVLPFDDNVCLREPCENYMKCVSVLRFDSSAPFLASASTLFRPIQPIAGLRCRCPPGFTGDFCETELDLCYSNPCRNGGACSRREGGYTCVCRPRFTGEDCELDTEAGRCVPGVCRNGGTCANGPDGGFRCQCPAGGAFEGPRCEVAARSFPPSSFVMFRGLRQRFHLTLSLSFATVQPSGLLFYNGRLNEKHDFLALELVAGQGPSKDKVAVLSVDDCDAAVALQFGAEIGNYSCAAAGTQTSSKKSLDLTGPLLLGGVPNLPENFPVSHKDFVGCMRDLHIDGRRVDMASFVANNGTVAGCQAKLHFCDSGPCKNNGICSERWGGFSCDCPVGFGGKDCRLTMAHPHHFRGNGTLSWDFGNDVALSVPWYLGLAFRTRVKQGVLMQVQAGPHSTLLCQDTLAVGSELQGLKVKRLHVGGLPHGAEEEAPQGLVGCIQEFHYRPRGSDSCLPCDCYPVGSTSRSCAPHSGQCPCRPGALGRQCNSCDSPFAEVTASGCRGAAVRLCDEDRGWLEPDLFNCTSPAFRELNLLLDGLELNKTVLDTVEAKKLAQRLREVTGHTDHYFSQDVRVTARLLAHLLAFESRQQGFGLTATQDAHFNENLLWAGSALLAPETGDLWAALGQRAPGGSPGSAGLVQRLEEYAATLARNMELTYLNPVGLVTPNIMLSIDRMEHPSPTRGTRRYPRYHSNLFRGQDAWDPHTHVLLSSQAPRPSPAEVLYPSGSSMENATTSSVAPPPAPPEPEPEPGISIVILLVYRTLGGLLPAQFQAERRGARADQHGLWTARDCELVHRNGSHARCRCSRTGTFGVLMDASPRERLEGDLELLAVFTHVVMAVSVAALLLTAAILLSLRSLKSNMRGIHANVAAALGVAELLFLLGIHRTQNQLLCTAVAILLHYFFLGTFAWLLVQGLHLYRMQVEPRNVDRGAMRFYHALGWGVPAVLLGLAVGLDPEGYGNPDFCWISIHEPLIWSFAGPVILVLVMNGTMFLLAARMSCSTGQREAKKTSVLTLRSSFLLLLLISASWLFGLLAVNHSILAFHYLHAGLCGLQGLVVLLLFCVLNADARAAWTPACLGRKAAPEEARPAPGTGPGAYNNTALFEESGLIRITLGASTVSSVSSARSGRTQDQDSQRGRSYLRDNVLVRHGSAADHTDHGLQAHAGPTDLDVAMFHRDAGGGADSDSDSDLSLEEERSLSIPSSESEDNGRTRGRFQRPLHRAAQSERLLTHPKADMDGNDLLSYWPALGECEAAPCALQTWGSERRLGLDTSKDAANNNQPDLALTSGDETSLGGAQRQRKGIPDAAVSLAPGEFVAPDTHCPPRVPPAGILKNRLQYPLVPQTRGAPELSWCRAATLGHRAVPAASYGRICAGGTGSLSQPASRYSSREQLDLLLRRQLSRERLEEAPAPVLRPLSRPGSQERLDAVPGRPEPRDRGSTLPRRQPPRDHPGATVGRFGSRDALDRGAPCEWLSTLPPPRGARDLDPQPPPLPLSPQRQLSRDPLLPSRPLDSLSKRSNSGERLDHTPSRHPSREGLGPPPQLLRVREAPTSGPSHGPSTEQLDILSSILASFTSSALSSSVQSSGTPSGPHTTATPSATASALGPSTPRSTTSHSISELSPDSEVPRSEGHS